MNESGENEFTERRAAPSEGSSLNAGPKVAIENLSPPFQQILQGEEEMGGAPLRHFLEVIKDHKWAILVTMLLGVAGTAVVTKQLHPLYEAGAVVNVERRGNGGIVGGAANAPSVSFDVDQVIATQMELIKSDTVLRPAVEKYHLLDVERQFNHLTAEEAARLRSSSIVLKRLKVTRLNNTYLIKIGYRAPTPEMAADVSNMIAASYLEHAFDSRDRSYVQVSKVIEHRLQDLQGKIDASGQALTQFNKQMNIIDPEQRVSILSARLLQLNNDYTAAQSERLRKQAVLDSVKSGKLAAAEVSAHAENLEHLVQDLNVARQIFAVVKTVYGENHPEYKKAQSKLAELEKQFQEMKANTLERVEQDYSQALAREQMAAKLVAETKAEVDRLNSRAFEYQELKSAADNYKKVYEDLQRVTGEEDINRTFQDTVIQIEDSARIPAKQVFPILWLNLVIASLLSGLSGLAGVVLYDSLDTKLKTAERVARRLNVEVIASLPRRKRSLPLAGRTRSGRVVGKVAKTARTKMMMLYQESIRALRNNIDFADHSLRTLLLTSATSGEGKSTIASNLSFSYALLGKKVLVIDADFHNPSLHFIFEKVVGTGLAEILEEKEEWPAPVLKVAREQLYLLPAGEMSDKSSDLVGTQFRQLLDRICEQYDLVIIDGPPLLSASEAAQMASMVDGIVVCASANSSAERTEAGYQILRRARGKILGLVLDDVRGGGMIDYGRDRVRKQPIERLPRTA